jgi:hypothetical protein
MAGVLLFYDPLAGQGTFYMYDPFGGLTPLKINSGWRSTWKQIVWGWFADPAYDSLLFYDGEGTGEFYLVDPTWYLYPPIKTYTGWVSPAGLPWTHIIGIDSRIDRRSHTDLLFYDSAGTGAFYRTHGEGEIEELRTYSGWVSPAGVPWTHIIKTKFSDSEYTDLLFYDSAGTGAFYTTDGQGGMPPPVQTYTGWVSPAGIPWKQIVQFNFPFSTTSGHVVWHRHLLFYDGAGTGAFYTIDQEARIHPLRTHTGWVSPAGTPWKQIVPCLDYNPGNSGLLFYEGAGTGVLYRYDEQGGLHDPPHGIQRNLPSGPIIFPFNVPGR